MTRQPSTFKQRDLTRAEYGKQLLHLIGATNLGRSGMDFQSVHPRLDRLL